MTILGRRLKNRQQQKQILSEDDNKKSNDKGNS